MTSTRRLLPLAIAALLAASTAVAALAHTQGTEATGGSGHHHGIAAMTHDHAAAISPTELALRRGMDRLWEEHAAWTRLAIISLTSGAPDTKATVSRLLANQDDIGNAIKPFYGAAAGRQLTALLRSHILIAADLIAAAKNGDEAGVGAQQARWNANADRIAAFLSSANPRFWKPAPMKAMMREHLGLTTNEVLARLKGHWAADVDAYDRIERQILHMSEMLSDGLVGQFPARFA